jgi:hypothetical protein
MYLSETRIFAAFLSEGQSLRRHLLEHVKPWLAANTQTQAPRLMGAYEDGDVEIKAETHRTAMEVIGGEWALITRPWQSRRDAMLDTLTKAAPFTFRPIVQIDPVNTSLLSQALNGRLYEKEKTEKKNYHVVNAFTLLLTRLELWKATGKAQKPLRTPPSYMCV